MVIAAAMHAHHRVDVIRYATLRGDQVINMRLNIGCYLRIQLNNVNSRTWNSLAYSTTPLTIWANCGRPSLCDKFSVFNLVSVEDFTKIVHIYFTKCKLFRENIISTCFSFLINNLGGIM